MLKQRTTWVALLSVVIVGVGLVASGTALTRPTGLVVAAPPAQQGVNRAAIVVNFGDNNVQMKCISFTEPVITAEALLLRADFDFILNTEGNVCRIGTVGCPASNCYCQCGMIECVFWGYFHLVGDRWQRALDSVTWYEVRDGAVEGWSWGSANFSIGVPPPLVTFDQICSPQGATPTQTVAASPTATTAATQIQLLAPEVVIFQADSWQVTTGGCTVLQWRVLNADRVTLDDVPVNLQDQREVCPAATQRYVLTASNATGQTVRELTVQVMPAPTVITAGTPAQTLTSPLSPLASPGMDQVGTPTPATFIESSTTATLTPDVQAVVFGTTVTATPTRRTLPAGLTATPLLRPTASPALPVATAETEPDSSPQHLLILALGLIVGAGALSAIAFWAVHHRAQPEK